MEAAMKERERKVGQLFIVGFQGAEVTSVLREVLTLIRPGGVILFKRNVENPAQIARLNAEVQQIALAEDNPPLFMAIDQEGGVVSRLDKPFTRFPSQGELENATYDQIFSRGALMAKELKLVGLNMNLAPVLDVRRDDDATKNFWRSFSHNPHRVASLGIALIRGLQLNGIMACAKHFPGLGEARVDPHLELPTVHGDLEVGLIPFRGAIAQNVAAVMMSHALYPAVDARRQASLSPEVIHRLLRRKLGYNGVVITDDLEMGAVANTYSLPECAMAAFEAGADVLLVCSKLESVPQCFEALLRMVSENPALEERLNQSVERILRLKKQYLLPYSPPDYDKIQDYFEKSGLP
jgi:beta-N-acetylhexosaminidase